MTFLLVVYLFLSDGTVLSERHDVNASNIGVCQEAGRQYGRAMWERHQRNGTSAYLCIARNQ